MEEERAESYRALYRVRPLLYHIGDIRLWVPIRQDGIVLWFAYVGIFFFLCYIVPILTWIIPLDRMIIMGLSPILAAYYSVKLDPAGKTVPRYLHDLVRFHLRPKWLIKWRVMRFSVEKQKIRFQGTCRSYLRRKTELNVEEWRGSTGRLQGKVKNLLSLLLPAMQKAKWHGRGNHLSIVPASVTSIFLPIPFTLSVKKKRSIQFSTDEPVAIKIQAQNEGWEWQVTLDRVEPSSKSINGGTQ